MINLETRTRVSSYAVCLFLILVTSLFISSVTYPSLTQETYETVFHSMGMIGLSGTIARSGSPADIQNAVDSVNYAGGGTVYIPAGIFHWNGETVTIPGGVNVVGASYAGCMGHENNWQSYVPKTILHNDAQPTSSYFPPNMFYLDGRNGLRTRISGIQFEATPPLDASAESTTFHGAAIEPFNSQNYRIDHCTFIDFSNVAIYAYNYQSIAGGNGAYGLVDHCIIDDPYKDTITAGGWVGGYGIDATGNMRTTLNNWKEDIALFAGKYEAIPDVSLVIIEDCHFSRTRHAVDGANGGVVVARHCLFNLPANYQTQPRNIGDVSIHQGWGPPSGTMTAAELLEAYDNVIDGRAFTPITPSDPFETKAVRIRGGHALIYNNYFHPPLYPNPQSPYGNNVFLYLDMDDPNKTFDMIDQTYIWNNDVSTDCTFIYNPYNFVLGTDYFLRAPMSAQDGWIYTPYPYPHPLVAG